MNFKKNFNKYFNSQEHPFRLIGASSLPILTSSLTLFFVSEILNYFYYKTSIFIILISFFSFFFILSEWFYNVSKESNYHTKNVQINNKLGFIFFIISEIMFFISLFWAFFHASLSPAIVFDNQWPPKGLIAINAFGPPTWGTWILWLSSIYAFHIKDLILCNYKKNTLRIILSFFILITLALFFTTCQLFEFEMSTFSFREGIYGSVFYLLTGFHGLHVIIGTIFLVICGLRFFCKIETSFYFIKVIQNLRNTFYKSTSFIIPKDIFFNKKLFQWGIYFKFLIKHSIYFWPNIIENSKFLTKNSFNLFKIKVYNLIKNPSLEVLRPFMFKLILKALNSYEKDILQVGLRLNFSEIKVYSTLFVGTFKSSKLNIYLIDDVHFWKIWEPSKFSGLETAIWYWQFVDIIWIFVWIIIYTWGNKSLPFNIQSNL